MPKTEQPHNQIDVRYCDDSTSQETFLTDAYGNISAMTRFRDFVKMAEENDKIWTPIPHVVMVHILMPEDPTGTMECTEKFGCPCGKKKALAGAGV